MTTAPSSAGHDTDTAGGPPQVLSDLRDLTEPAMQAAVGRLHPDLAKVESYHRGWTTLDGSPAGRPTGKAMRPVLALLSSRAVGGPDAYGIAAGVAVELIHDFSLLHDDLMDGDTERRHQPTAWMAYGAGAAILSGDALVSLATQMLLDTDSPHTLDAIKLMNRCIAELITGQARDLEFEHRKDISLAECKAMADGKTAALLECASALGAVLCGAGADQVDALARFGRELGLAFQLVDDILGIWGDSQVTGKPVLNDLRSRKKTLPITAALESDAPGLDALRGLMLGDGEILSEESLEAAAQQLSAAGFRQWALDEAREHLAAAEHHAARAGAPAAVTADLIAIARFSVSRWF
jgi:geranylgeranyl diphosphate synthase, type I